MARLALQGSLAVPDRPIGALLLTVRAPEHRRDDVRLQVADFLHRCRFATLVVSLGLDTDGGQAVPLERLAGRVASGVDWMEAHPRLQDLAIGVLADGDAVAPALVAAAHLQDRVTALVVLGGRPDRASAALPHVLAPTLFAVGELDSGSADGARRAAREVSGEAEIVVMDGSRSPLGDLDSAGAAALLARSWFVDHLGKAVG